MGEDWASLWLKHQKTNIKKIKKFFDVFSFYNVSFDKKIIDIGCGTGDALYILRERGYKHLMGIELKRALFECSDKFGLIKQGSCLDLGFVKERQDVALVFGVLHHLNGFDEMKLCLDNIKDLLGMGGRLYSVEPRKSFARTFATKLFLETPLCNIHSFFKIESELWKRERKEFSNWLKLEARFTDYASESGFDIAFYKRDSRYRYIVFEKVL